MLQKGYGIGNLPLVALATVVMVDSKGLEAIFNRLEAGKPLGKQDLQTLVAAVRSQQVTLATGDRAVAIGGSADGAVIVTGDRNVVIRGADTEAIRALAEKRSRTEQILLQAIKDEVNARLKQSLHNEVLIQLEKELQPEQVKRPWDSDIKIGNKPVEAIPDSWSISRAFDEVQGKLLILGAPGAGKTTTMLGLAQALCDRAEQITNFPIPVLFNLSTWKQDKQLLRDWLVRELQAKYGVRREISTKWLRDAKLLPMLDGLDELESSRQETCVGAINQFLQSEERSQYLVVCSRFEEYSNYKTRIQLNGAIYLRELTEQQIQNYLARNGSIEFWERIRNKHTILKLVRTPLLLSITTLAYEDLSLERWGQLGSTEAQLEYLLDTYINKMLNRPLWNDLSVINNPSVHQTKKWLIWLAQQLQKQFQTEFLIEKIQPFLLETHRQRWLYSAATKIATGLFLGLGYLLHIPYGNPLLATLILISLLIWIPLSVSYSLRDKMSTELILGFIVSIAIPTGNIEKFVSPSWLLFTLFFIWFCGSKIANPSPAEIEPVTTLNLDFKKSRREIFLSFLGGLSAGLVALILFGIASIPPTLVLALIVGLGSGFVFLMGFGLTGRMINSDLKIGANSNQGIRKSALNAVKFTVFLGLTSGLAISFIFVPAILSSISFPNDWSILSMALQIKLNFPDYANLANNLYKNQEKIPWARDVLELSQRSALYLSLQLILSVGRIACPLITIAVFSFGIVGGLTHGGIACIRHFTLRIILYCNHYIPWNYASFLNYCTDRLLLQRVGGRYRFIHRLLQEHFAAMPLEKVRGDR